MRISSAIWGIVFAATFGPGLADRVDGASPGAALSSQQISSQEQPDAEGGAIEMAPRCPEADASCMEGAQAYCDGQEAWCGLDCRAARSAGLVGGAELLFLRPFFADGHPAGNLFGYEASPRFWLGYTASSGLGIRARYWDFDHRGSSEEDGTFRLNTSVFDLELVDAIRLGSRWDATLSAGWRRVDFDFLYDEEPNTEGSSVASNGLTAAAELRRYLPCGFSAFGGFRAAWLFGDVTYRAPWLEEGPLHFSGTTQWMTEMQLGVQWARPLTCWNAHLLTRAGVEAQWWNAFATNMDAPEIGLFGYFLTVGIRR